MSKRPRPILAQLKSAIAQAERRGVSRAAIAKGAKISPIIITRIMAGKSRPRIDIAERIAHAVGLNLALTKRQGR
ncbi:MAG: helix-turn-helix transcriptional regulator [Phycisphaeraceae bacterium]